MLAAGWQTVGRWSVSAAVGPELILAAIGLGGGGVTALWKIANNIGASSARTAAILDSMTKMLADHEARLREVERYKHEH